MATNTHILLASRFLRRVLRSLNEARRGSSTNGARTTGYSQTKIMKLDSYLRPYSKLNSNWINDGNIRAKTIKF